MTMTTLIYAAAIVVSALVAVLWGVVIVAVADR